jgi:hypothetical protein
MKPGILLIFDLPYNRLLINSSYSKKTVVMFLSSFFDYHDNSDDFKLCQVLILKNQCIIQVYEHELHRL